MSLKRWAVCGAVVLAACGGDGKGPGFSDELRRNFLASCEESSGGDESACECLLDELESRITEAEFVALEAEGEDVFLGDRRVQASLKACR